MKCHQVQQGLLLETSGELGFWRTHQLHHHLAACPPCRQWQADLRRLTTVEYPSPSTPALNPAFFSIFDSPSVPAPRSDRRVPVAFLRFPALAATLAILLAGGGWWGWSRWTVHQTETQNLARVDRLQEWTLLAAIVNGEDLSDIDPDEALSPEAARQELARQLQRLQDPQPEEITPDEGLTPSARHSPTVLPGHNTPASHSEKYG